MRFQSSGTLAERPDKRPGIPGTQPERSRNALTRVRGARTLGTHEMKPYRKNLNSTDDQIAPIWFVFGLHTLIHILGIFVVTLLPYSWCLGTPTQTRPFPPFMLVMWVSGLSLVWASLRLAVFRTARVPVMILLLIPVLMSAGSMVYAQTVMHCTDAGRAMREAELQYLNQRIERYGNRPQRVRWEIEERDRLREELK